VGRGPDAEWLGSIGWDGYPDGIDRGVLESTSEAMFRAGVAAFLDREDGTKPEQGWPWPWNDSNTTDYVYAFTDGKVWAWSTDWFDPLQPEPEDVNERRQPFPDMSTRKNVTLGPRSGLVVFNG
jgi:hypothetical protein